MVVCSLVVRLAYTKEAEALWISRILPVILVTKGVTQCEAGGNLTIRGCRESYSKEMSDGCVIDRIQSRNPLILCICKVDNRSGSESWRCEGTNMKNEGPHLSIPKNGNWSAAIYTAGKTWSQINQNRRRFEKHYGPRISHTTQTGSKSISLATSYIAHIDFPKRLWVLFFL